MWESCLLGICDEMLDYYSVQKKKANSNYESVHAYVQVRIGFFNGTKRNIIDVFLACS